jgi:predicted dehydrogenase
MPSEPLKLGMVGCGDISHAHGNAAARIPRLVRFVAACDLRREAAEAWAARYGAERCYTDYEEMVRAEPLDGVLLATWPNQHREQIERCLAAGARGILCEKALTLTGQEAAEIWQLVTAAGATLMEGFMYRHHPAVRKLERLVAAGEIGPVDNVRAVFNAYDPEGAPGDDASRNWRQRKECGGGVPYDFACYAVNACGHFTGGLPVRVFATGAASERYDTISRLYGLIEYDNGCVGSVESTKKADFNQELAISGPAGILYLPISWTTYHDITLERRHSAEWGRVMVDTWAVRAADAYQAQLENFAAAISGEAAPTMPLIQSVVNTFAVEALVTSLLERRIVEIDIPAQVAAAFGRREEVCA